MKYIILSFLALLASMYVNAQNNTNPDPDKNKTDTVKYWNFDGLSNINFSQIGLSNWAGGGQESISFTGLQKLTLTYDNKENQKWLTQLELNYGLIKQGSQNEFRKSDDQILFSSKYDRKLKQDLNISALLDFRTQFDKGFNYVTASNPAEDSAVLISQFMAPAYLVASVGFEYNPTDNVYFMLAPVSGKSTFVLDDSLSQQGAYGVTAGKKVRQEFGVNFSNSVKWPIMENVNFESNLNMFANYKTLFEIDVNWDGGLFLKINEFLSASITSRIIYDEDVLVKAEGEEGPGSPKVQFKEVVALGFNYTY